MKDLRCPACYGNIHFDILDEVHKCLMCAREITLTPAGPIMATINVLPLIKSDFGHFGMNKRVKVVVAA